jgi:hypothetical protein
MSGNPPAAARSSSPRGRVPSSTNSARSTPVAKSSAFGQQSTEDNTNPFQNIPYLRDTSASERSDLLRKKLQICCIMYDFNQQTFLKEKESKRQTLLEIVEYVNVTRNCFNEAIMQDVVVMVGFTVCSFYFLKFSRQSLKLEPKLMLFLCGWRSALGNGIEEHQSIIGENCFFKNVFSETVETGSFLFFPLVSRSRATCFAPSPPPTGVIPM